jgi:cobalt-zinc-cadmium resistance protein CzcA
LAGIPGIVEVSGFGGYVKQYEVGVDPLLLRVHDLSLLDVLEALARNNQNSGGSYLEKGHNAYYVRMEGMARGIEDIENIVIANRAGTPVLIRHVGRVGFGSSKRFGAMTMDGRGEAVGGITMMLKGANSSQTVNNVRQRMESVRRSLPPGIDIYPYLDRSELVGKTTQTVRRNLMHGGLIVIIVLILLLGDWRAGLITASVIPLSLLFAIIMMHVFGVSANLMSLGAIDFGIVVDGPVIVVEGVVFALAALHAGRHLSQEMMDEAVARAASKLFRAAVFGVFIILVVFVPILSLSGIEGKMFRPMAFTFSFAVLGALILSLTYVPMMAALLLPKHIETRRTLAERLMEALKKVYQPALRWSLRAPYVVLSAAVALFVSAIFLFRTLGAEFIPTLEEGDLAMQMTIPPGSSLEESIRSTTKAERILLENFPEVRHVVSKIGAAEVPTDPMAIEDADIMIVMVDKKEWTSARDREELVALMKEKLSVIAGASFEFTQPIQLRFNELMTGAKTDIAVRIFGEDHETLKRLADRAAAIMENIPGAGDVKVEQTLGLPQLIIEYDRAKVAEHGLHIEALNTLARAAYAGEPAGVVFEHERKFDLVVRFDQPFREELNLDRIFACTDEGRVVPLSEVARARYAEGPIMISREDTRRRITVGVNVRERDLASLVADIEARLDAELALPSGYYIDYGGQFENLREARRRLLIAAPAALALIFLLLYFTFGRFKYVAIIFTAAPMAAIGGIASLWLRGMPFSISAGVGFIALFGVAVLDGIVLISHFNRLRYEEGMTDIRAAVLRGAGERLRPVLITSVVAALGFLPMALSTSNGAEVQRPLATVVIGGVISATFLTLLVIPTLYYLVNRNLYRRRARAIAAAAGMLVCFSAPMSAQAPALTLEAALDSALFHHPALRNAGLQTRIAHLGEEEARRVPPTLFQLQSGQMNTLNVDYNLMLEQSLGNWAANRQRRTLAAAVAAQSEREHDRLEHQIHTEVRRAYHEWVFRVRRREGLEQQVALFRRLAEKAELQLRAGEISSLERALVANQLSLLEREWNAARLDEEDTYAALRQQAFLRQDYRAPETPLPPLPLPDTAMVGEALLAPLARQIEVARQETLLERKEMAPEFSLAYFNQSIRPDIPLQGVTAGVSLPIFTRSQKARIQQSQLRELIAINNWEMGKNVVEQNRRRAARQVVVAWRQHEEQGARLSEQIQQLRLLAERQLQAGEVDYFRYLQSLEFALRGELELLDITHRYNLAVIDFLLWSE